MNPAREQVARNLKRLRVRRGLSQEELGFRAGVHRTQISKFERGETLPEIETLIRLCGALAVEPNDLMAGISWEPPPPPTALTGRFRAED
jgi:transcriptional regulator with XRE-family HTH domain